MDGIFYELDHEQQFWDELQDMLSNDHSSQHGVDHGLQLFLDFSTTFMDKYLKNDENLVRCCTLFRDSTLVRRHHGYVRRKMIRHYVDGPFNYKVYLILSLCLLLDGQENSSTFEMMQEENSIERVVDIIWHRKNSNKRLYRVTQEVFYEMCRIQRLSKQALEWIDSDFFLYLLDTLEVTGTYDQSVYCQSIMKILLVLNEQYMIAAVTSPQNTDLTYPLAPPIRNKLIEALSNDGQKYRTFGENIILMLNREQEACLQLLILKLLYLLFTKKETYDYFYTNDLRVLVDVIVRELRNLADEYNVLKCMYLRVLFPLLAHTQIRHTDYQFHDIVKALNDVVGVGMNPAFMQVSGSILRLVARCASVGWLPVNHELEKAIEDKSDEECLTPASSTGSITPVGSTSSNSTLTPAAAAAAAGGQNNTVNSFQPLQRITSRGGSQTPPPPPPSRSKLRKKRHLDSMSSNGSNSKIGVSLYATSSNASLADVAVVPKPPPGVIARRKDHHQHNNQNQNQDQGANVPAVTLSESIPENEYFGGERITTTSVF